MGTASNLWQRLGGVPDPRSDREVAGDIDEELAFHLEQRERELLANGLDHEAARAQALERFGDIEKVRAECRRVQMGGSIMLQRVTLLILVILVATVAWLSFQSVTSQRAAQAQIESLHAELSGLMKMVQKGTEVSPVPENASHVEQASVSSLGYAADGIRNGQGALGQLFLDPVKFTRFQGRAAKVEEPKEEATSVETWIQRFNDETAKGVESDAVARLLMRECSATRVTQVLRGVWAPISADQRMSLLNVVGSSASEQAARLAIHFGATDDGDAQLAARAFTLLRELTFVRFDAESRAQYLAWYGANKDLGIAEIVEKTAPALVQELSMFSTWNETCALYSPLVIHENLSAASSTKEALRKAGAVALIQKWARLDDLRARVAAVQWMAAIGIDEVTARMIVMPMLSDPAARDTALVTAICSALVDLECTWAWEPLLSELGRLMRSKDRDTAQLEAVATALGHMDEKLVVPTILAWIAWAKSPQAARVLGETALYNLTGVSFEPTHDSEWWLNWWSIHRADYPNSADTETGLPRVFTW